MTHGDYYVPMRKPKGKLVALLAGAVVVVLVAVTATFWKDVYCHLFLDPRLVGRWEGQVSGSLSTFDVRHTGYVINFDKVGNTRSTKESWTTSRASISVGTYRIDGNSLTIVWPHGVWSNVYRVEGDTLTLLDSSGPETYRRVPDDS